MKEFRYVFVYLVALFLFWLPTIVAHATRHRYRWPITVLNLLAVPWIFCLIWAVWPPKNTNSNQ